MQPWGIFSSPIALPISLVYGFAILAEVYTSLRLSIPRDKCSERQIGAWRIRSLAGRLYICADQSLQHAGNRSVQRCRRLFFVLLWLATKISQAQTRLLVKMFVF